VIDDGDSKSNKTRIEEVSSEVEQMMELISTLAIEVNNNRGMIQKDLVQC